MRGTRRRRSSRGERSCIYARWASCLRTRYAMSGTDVAYGAICPRACFRDAWTETACVTTRTRSGWRESCSACRESRCAIGIRLVYSGTGIGCAMSGTGIGYAMHSAEGVYARVLRNVRTEMVYAAAGFLRAAYALRGTDVGNAAAYTLAVRCAGLRQGLALQEVVDQERRRFKKAL
eukprot:63816-Rhodomonas_salina.3